jgi:hypothetical protein
MRLGRYRDRPTDGELDPERTCSYPPDVPLTLEARLQLTKQLADYFRRHHQEDRLKPLRLYYAFIRDLIRDRPPPPQPPSHDQIEHLAAILQLPPFEDRYPVRTNGAICDCGAATWRFEDEQFPDRVFRRCRDCHKVWLVLEQSKLPPPRH